MTLFLTVWMSSRDTQDVIAACVALAVDQIQHWVNTLILSLSKNTSKKKEFHNGIEAWEEDQAER
jgi:Leu/Phe-tRNA-protein transferase